MLGEVIGDANGRATTIEVLSVEQGSPKLKVTMRGNGKANGVAFTDLITYTQVEKGEGRLYAGPSTRRGSGGSCGTKRAMADPGTWCCPPCGAG